MSLFQCEHCGCAENTALSAQGFTGGMAKIFDWSGIEDRKGKLLCSACGPSQYRSGEPTEFGVWHGLFERTYLPKGLFITNTDGNLAHRETGSVKLSDYALLNEEPPK